MSNNKQSSVEWLIIQAVNWARNIDSGNDIVEFPKGAINQAKEMEKKQCVDFALKCMLNGLEPHQSTREVVEKLFDEGLQ